MHRRVPLTSFLDFSTIEKMAQLLRDDVGPSAPPIEGEAALADAARRDLFAATAGAGLDPIAPGMASFNSAGGRPPLFWCFNRLGMEPGPMAQRLGSDQPLHAMLSGAQLIDWGPETADALADHYLRSILDIQPEGPYRLGGNCTGGRVAIALAQRLQERGATVERLCLLEHFEPVLYRHPGPLLLVYGRESHLRVYRSFGWPDRGWEARFDRRPEVVLTPGGHGEFFNDGDNLGALTDNIVEFLDRRH